MPHPRPAALSPAARAILLLLPLAASSCGPRTRAEPYEANGGCRRPDSTKFHAVQALTSNAMAPELDQRWVNGCAIVSFELDAQGHIVDPIVEMEHPAGSGAGQFAIAAIAPDLYAPNSGHYIEALAPSGPHPRYALSIGFADINGHHVATRRTVTKYYIVR